MTQVQKRNVVGVELNINDDKELFRSLLGHRDEIEKDTGIKFDWRELPDRKASRILVEKAVAFAERNRWNSQFDWIIDTMLKMKKAFRKYI